MKKPSVKSVLKKYSWREGNSSKDFVEKATSEIARRFAGYEHVSRTLTKPVCLMEAEHITRRSLKPTGRQ